MDTGLLLYEPGMVYGIVVGNNPVNWIDPKGLAVAAPLPLIATPPGFAIVAGTAVGVGVYAGTSWAIQGTWLGNGGIGNWVYDLVHSKTPTPPADPTQSPGEGWEWRGNGAPGSGEGSWYNPGTGESLHPDLDHPEPIGPHWDYKDPQGNKTRIPCR